MNKDPLRQKYDLSQFSPHGRRDRNILVLQWEEETLLSKDQTHLPLILNAFT